MHASIIPIIDRESILLSFSIAVKKIQPDTRVRTATIDFSPLLPSGNPIHFVIDESGPRGIDIK